MREAVYRLLDRPWLYRLQEAILAPGARTEILRVLGTTAKRVQAKGELLDVGCGPESWLLGIGLHPVGVDISPSYLQRYAQSGDPAVAASADALPFGTRSFQGVWSVGLLHHVPDEAAHRALQEMVRVCRPGGHVVVFDAVLPEHFGQRPLASLIRSFDRGRFMRSESELRALLPTGVTWGCERVTYSSTGLEALICCTE